MEFDPVLALTYREEEGLILTVTMNGLLREWPFRRGRAEKPIWETLSEMSAALTGRRFVSASYIQRIPQAEYVKIRERVRASMGEVGGER